MNLKEVEGDWWHWRGRTVGEEEEGEGRRGLKAAGRAAVRKKRSKRKEEKKEGEEEWARLG